VFGTIYASGNAPSNFLSHPLGTYRSTIDPHTIVIDKDVIKTRSPLHCEVFSRASDDNDFYRLEAWPAIMASNGAP